jgi:hypothetical protein
MIVNLYMDMDESRVKYARKNPPCSHMYIYGIDMEKPF